jgi:hypothetical protein
MSGSTRIANTPSQAIPESGTTHKQNTISTTAEAIINWTLADNTSHVLVQFLGANARVTLDGATTPTASVGFQFAAGSTAYWTRQTALAAQAIREGGTDVVVEAQELNYL